MWKYYALLSALFASATAILAKYGVKNIDSNFATAIRTSFILVLVWSIVLFSTPSKQIGNLSKSNLLFLGLSGVATGLSWLFYFKALQLGKASEVALVDKFSVVLTIILASIFLNEAITPRIVFGTALVVAGTLIVISK